MLTKKGEEFTHRQLRWYERLEPYTFTVTYIKGKDNAVPDALSRTPAFYEVKALELIPKAPHHMITADEFEQAMQADHRYMTVVEDADARKVLDFHVNKQGALETRDHRVCVPNDDTLRYKLVLEAYEPLYSGHFGYT